MSVIVDAGDFNATLKLGLSKVKSPFVLVSASKSLLTLAFHGPAVRYRRWIPCKIKEGSGFSEKAVDSQLLQKLLTSYKGDIEINTSNTHLSFKSKGVVTLPYVDFNSDFNPYEVKDVEQKGGYKGTIKNHPLYMSSNLKKSLQAIKDNIAKEELMVEAKWGGKSKTLDVMVIDQFHGILCRINLDDVEKSKKEYDIKLPLSAFLLLIDSKGDITIEGSRLEVRGEDFEMSFSFILGASYASIEDMIELVNVKPQVKIDGLVALAAAKKATAISESDDSLLLYTKKDVLYLKCETEKATIREAIPCTGKLSEQMKLTPKNFLDLLSSMGNTEISFSVSSGNLIARTHGKNAIFGAMAKME